MTREKASLIFMGTPDFAAESLRFLASRYTVKLVLSQPDRPRGRGKMLQPSPVKALALDLGIPVLTPEKLDSDKEALEELKRISPDFIVVVAYGQILPKEVLELPRFGCINLHASLLPALRGAAPIQEAIIRGDEESGNTTMLMNEGLDTGAILLQDRIMIPDDMTYGDLHQKLMESGPVLLDETIRGILEGTIQPVEQPVEGVSYVSKFSKKDAEIDFNRSSRDILNLIRGMNPSPLAYTWAGAVMVKILEAKERAYSGPEPAGTILEQEKDGILVRTGDGAVSIQTLQLPGKRPMPVRDFLNGNHFNIDKFKKE